MILKEILQQLETSPTVVAKALFKTEHCKMVAIGFKKGMHLNEHQTPVTAKLFVLSGRVIYTWDGNSVVLNQYDEQDIPAHLVHALEASEDSMCLLIRG